MMKFHSETNNQKAAKAAAAFILKEAAAAGFKIGTDGCDFIIAPPRGMSRESRASFTAAIIANRDEIIDMILRENGLAEDDPNRDQTSAPGGGI
jgi:hypothetical protein